MDPPASLIEGSPGNASPPRVARSQSAEETDQRPAPCARLHSDVPPLRIEPEFEVVFKKSGESQQRQPRAGRDRILRIDRDTLAHLQSKRWPAAGRVLPAGEVRV